MKELENIVIGKSSIPALVITVVLMIAIPVVFFIYWRVKHREQTGITMAEVFEECGRFIVMKYIMKKNRTRENSIMYGIGHGGIEIIAVLIPGMISSLVIAVMLSTGDRTTALASGPFYFAVTCPER